MDIPNTLRFVFAALLTALALASLMGWTLKLRFAPHTPHTVIDGFNTRVEAWWAMIIFMGLAIWVGKIGLLLYFAFISFQCLREYISVTRTGINDHNALLWSFYFFLPAQYIILAFNLTTLFNILIPVYGFVVLPISSILRNDFKDFLSRTAQVHWGLMICVYFLSYILALMSLTIVGYEGANALLIIFLILTVQANNIFQYVWRILLERKQPVTDITVLSSLVARLAGGITSSTMMGTILWWITPFSIWQAGLIALLISIAGFLGSLVLLGIKRDRGVKSWGYVIDGHNGSMLDRIGSISFAAPVFFHIVQYFWAQSALS